MRKPLFKSLFELYEGKSNNFFESDKPFGTLFLVNELTSGLVDE